MKQLLQQYAAYNIWANKILLEKVRELPEKQLHRQIVSSFPGIYNTVLHMMDVESIWWQRLKLAEHVEFPSLTFKGNFEELARLLLQLSQKWEEWIRNANDLNIAHVFAYQNSKKELFKQPVYEALLHLFNHQSYHRGQLVTMLRQLGMDTIPPTDFIVFSRNKR